MADESRWGGGDVLEIRSEPDTTPGGHPQGGGSVWGEWGPDDPAGASWAIGCLGTVAPVSGRGLWQVQRVRENVPVSSGAVPPASGRGTGSMAAMRESGMDIQPHCAGGHGRAAAASGAPFEPIHDLLMSETQLRSSPSGTGRSLLGLEKDVCQRESALAPAWG